MLVKVVVPPLPETVKVALLTARRLPELSYSAVQVPDSVDPSENSAPLIEVVTNVSAVDEYCVDDMALIEPELDLPLFNSNELSKHFV